MSIDYSSYTLEELFDALTSVNRKKFSENYKNIKLEIAKKQGGEYACPKCDCKGYEPSEMYVATDKFESMTDVESGKFVAISCLECGFTELYKGNTEASIFDYFLG